MGRERYEAQGYRADRFTMHAKLVMIDRRHVFVGTFNTDPRSMFINTEIGLFIVGWFVLQRVVLPKLGVPT